MFWVRQRKKFNTQNVWNIRYEVRKGWPQWGYDQTMSKTRNYYRTWYTSIDYEEIRRSIWWHFGCVEYHYGRIGIEGRREACVIATLSSTKSTRNNVLKGSRKTRKIGSPWKSKWLRMGCTFFCTTKSEKESCQILTWFPHLKQAIKT